MCDFNGPLGTLGRQKQGLALPDSSNIYTATDTSFFFSPFHFFFNPSLFFLFLCPSSSNYSLSLSSSLPSSIWCLLAAAYWWIVPASSIFPALSTAPARSDRILKQPSIALSCLSVGDGRQRGAYTFWCSWLTMLISHRHVSQGVSVQVQNVFKVIF